METNESRKQAPLQIPLPGGSGVAETGAVQFQNDWPGLFLRGDTAIVVAVAIRNLEKALANNEDPMVGWSLSKLVPVAAIVEREVKV
jgi:hypothetical protein